MYIVLPLATTQGAVIVGAVIVEVVVVRKSTFIHHHHYPEGVVYRGFCLDSSAVAVSEITSRRWWCV